jgi:hypothetical protein
MTMHDVISAFLDNEPFDAEEFSAALATPDGRRLLVDLVALQGMVQPAFAATPPAASRRVHWFGVSAAMVMLAGGFALGQWSARVDFPSSETAASAASAPEPTAEYRFEPGVNWREPSGTGGN